MTILPFCNFAFGAAADRDIQIPTSLVRGSAAQA
jgi:hypothetical protein